MSKELKTGIISIVIIALGIWGYNFLKGQNILSAASRKFYAEYKDISGLTEASFVTINGFKVGKISDISFNTDPNKKGKLIVEFIVNNDFEFSKNSKAKIVSSSLMGDKSLAIVPSYEGEIAKSGDFISGEVEPAMLSSIGEKLTPIQEKLDQVLLNADSLIVGLNQVLDVKARKSLNNSLVGLEGVVGSLRKTLSSVNGLLANNKVKLDNTLTNAEKITNDFSKVSEELKKSNIGQVVKKLETTLANANKLLSDINAGKGTMGKLVKDEAVYANLKNATKELEELLRELKLNPKRFLHFSLFGKKAKPYNEENNQKNTSNK